MTGQQLKNSILQMAVQGKLVPQDPNDEPASVLLERIRKEKEQLIKEGKIKKEKNPSYIFRGADNLPYEKVGNNEPVCIADEVPFEIPESWEWVRLANICTKLVDGDHNPPKGEPIQTSFIMASSTNINNDTLVDLEKVRFLSETVFIRENERTQVSVGDIFFTSVGSLGRSCVYQGGLNICFQRSVSVLTTLVYNYYLKYFFDSGYVQQKVFSEATGTAQKGFYLNQMAKLIVPVPPLPEQHRIVEGIRSILPLLTEYSKKEIEISALQSSFPDHLKKSILQEAVQGKLVPQDPADEPASVLLERIRAEKEQLIKAGKIKRDKHESVIFRRDNSHYEKCGSKEENINDIIPFELPDSWEWIRLSAILTSTDAGKSPQCENRPRTIGEWGVIKTTAIQDGYFLAEENKVLPLDFNLQKSMVVHHGDLLITRAGPRNRTGVICVVDGEPENLILSDKTVRLSYLRNFVNPHYVMTALSSPAMQYFVVDAMTGMAASQVNISQEKMKTFLLPLPPLNEQQRIVDEVSKIFGRIDKLNF